MDWTLATDVVAALVGLAALAFAVYQIALLVKGFKEGRI